MNVEFLLDGIRLVPSNPDENTKLADMFNVRTSIKPGTKPKVCVSQLVDKFGDPIENSYFMIIAADAKKDEFTETIELEKDLI